MNWLLVLCVALLACLPSEVDRAAAELGRAQAAAVAAAQLIEGACVEPMADPARSEPELDEICLPAIDAFDRLADAIETAKVLLGKVLAKEPVSSAELMRAAVELVVAGLELERAIEALAKAAQ